MSSPIPTPRVASERALPYTWLASIAAPTEHDFCGMRENLDLIAACENALICLSRPPSQQKNFIRARLHPIPACRLTADLTLLYGWLTSFVAPTEHDLCGLRKNSDPHARWRNAIGAARAMSRFVKGNGANNNKKDQLALSYDDEADIGSGSGLPSSPVTPEPDYKRQQLHLSPPSPDDHALRGGVVGLAAKETPKMTASPSLSSPMSFSDALYKAKAAAEAERLREGDSSCAQTMVAPQPRKTVEDEGEVVELRMPRSLDFVDHGGGAVRETPGAGIVDPFGVVRELVVADTAEIVVR